MQAVILAGGLGTRLGDVTSRVPKCMVPVGGRPFLEHQLRLLQQHGVKDVLLLVGHLAEHVQRHFGDGAGCGLRIRYSVDAELLGTAGAVKRAEMLLQERFVLLYGDSYLAIDYGDLWARFVESAAPAMMVVYADAAGETGVPRNVQVAADGRVAAYRKGAAGSAAALGHIDAGVVALRRSVLAGIPADRPASLESDLYPALARDGRLHAYQSSRRFYDIGTPERLTVFERVLAS
jgi:NDP-sugar pyrophosphorylase family protein